MEKDSDFMIVKGLIQVYTGNGKGKTTAALGQAVRGVGYGLKAIFIQFLKGNFPAGEEKLAQMLSPNFEVFRIPANYNPNEPQWSNVVLMENSQRIFQRAYEAITSGDYDIVVLDEINMAVYYNFIETNRLVELLAKKPEHVEVILTGRYARNEIIEIADIVTDMREVKHPLRAGMESRLGIDY